MASTLEASEENEEWDAEGFEIPRLTTAKEDSVTKEENVTKDALMPSLQKSKIDSEPYGEKLSKLEQPEINSSAKKQRLKNKLKDAEKKNVLLGPENKVDVLRDLMGGNRGAMFPKGGSEEWLDPYCQESMFDKSNSQC
ncbi:hypothetical protein O6H91_01G143900 [Diphasiastrum complanatum]|uniref:Uncharacterized protein n=1 Tax=Diphasiastrum complanatum TaxID=34168 RepID=A0ACC2EWZ1_DIPCM|nr:hypothetical protein O6H91_01G143900 [Diphasiastrum complanatum]